MEESVKILSLFERKKDQHLRTSILLDLGGIATYFLPILGEAFDLFYAPFYGIAIYSMYKVRIKSAIVGGIGGFIEEIIPLATDWIPTASILWVYNYKFRRDSTLAKFADRMANDRAIVETSIYKKQKPKLNFFKRLGTSIISVFYDLPQKNLPESSMDDIELLPSGEEAENSNPEL